MQFVRRLCVSNAVDMQGRTNKIHNKNAKHVHSGSRALGRADKTTSNQRGDHHGFIRGRTELRRLPTPAHIDLLGFCQHREINGGLKMCI